MNLLFLLATLGFQIANKPVYAHNATYNNPIIPGWHSDPSCTFVSEWNNTFFCTTSSFLAFPGCPVFASTDLVHWDLISNALNHPAQLPQIQTSTNAQTLGIFASTLRFRNGTFYLLTAWLDTDNPSTEFVLFTTTDPFDESAWTNAFQIQNPSGAIDPDLFWDDDGSVIMAFSGSPIKASYIDLATGNASEPFDMWNGTGYNNQEGPHLYKKDGYYYLLIAEGGTELHHSSTIARSKSIKGPWESSPHNPFVSARYTDRYFQTVGHSDLFQDAEGNWWGIALATRAGPALYNESIYPMGRETVLYPVSWPKGDWPLADQVMGEMSGPLPPRSSKAHSVPTFMGEPDIVDFVPGSSIPTHWVFWRAPAKPESFTISPPGHPNTLQLIASRANLTGDASFKALDGLTLLARRQTNTLFEFSVDVHPGFYKAQGDEIGVTAFLHQDHHIDLGLVFMGGSPNSKGRVNFRCRATDSDATNFTVPSPVVTPVPSSWLSETIRLYIRAENDTHYQLSAAPAARPHESRLLAAFTGALISGPDVFTGNLLGVYATTNGGNHTMEGYVSRWRYTPIAQQIDYNDFVRSWEL
ncbi:uncharacterized protein N7458_012080 [Penicillium daleae]|uniref:Beta-xylosidase C-terminal Concanavalin A-like domain-containing protein n=1 Tax=Penicillium daleae TaxID=63821 RepID=A0AAD6BWC5_9EURO|nr:uncharacterized protein N7458_012080 [Penicillium daleae]KAJ5432924.1 hypothetical protein N7458_012080 [Penicillium daleae]